MGFSGRGLGAGGLVDLRSREGSNEGDESEDMEEEEKEEEEEEEKKRE